MNHTLLAQEVSCEGREGERERGREGGRRGREGIMTVIACLCLRGIDSYQRSLHYLNASQLRYMYMYIHATLQSIESIYEL